MGETEKKELLFWEWAAKVNERITLIRFNVSNRKEITENDYALLESLFRLWHGGAYPIYENILKLTCNPVMQKDFFTDETDKIDVNDSHGMDIEVLEANLKIKDNV